MISGTQYSPVYSSISFPWLQYQLSISKFIVILRLDYLDLTFKTNTYKYSYLIYKFLFNKFQKSRLNLPHQRQKKQRRTNSILFAMSIIFFARYKINSKVLDNHSCLPAGFHSVSSASSLRFLKYLAAQVN
jgi:hypothetical protein